MRFQVLSIVMIAFTTPLIGLPMYFLMRPVQRFDVEPNETEPSIACKTCGEANDPTHEFCTWCWDKVTVGCVWCDHQIPVWYLYCPYCWAPRSKVLS